MTSINKQAIKRDRHEVVEAGCNSAPARESHDFDMKFSDPPALYERDTKCVKKKKKKGDTKATYFHVRYMCFPDGIKNTTPTTTHFIMKKLYFVEQGKYQPLI